MQVNTNSQRHHTTLFADKCTSQDNNTCDLGLQCGFLCREDMYCKFRCCLTLLSHGDDLKLSGSIANFHTGSSLHQYSSRILSPAPNNESMKSCVNIIFVHFVVCVFFFCTTLFASAQVEKIPRDVNECKAERMREFILLLDKVPSGAGIPR